MAFSTASQILTLENNSGAVLASLLIASGAIASGTYAVSNGSADGFTIGTAPDGDTILTTSLTTPAASGTSGSWQSPGSWLDGQVPGTVDTPFIGEGLSSGFTLTTGTVPVTVAGFTLLDPSATVNVTSDTIAGIVSDAFGTLEVTSGNTLDASSLSTTEQTAALTIDPGATVALSGHLNTALQSVAGTLSVAQGNTYAATFGGGTVVVDGALLAGPPTAAGGGGSTSIGYDSGGLPATVIVNSGGTATGYVHYFRLRSDVFRLPGAERCGRELDRPDRPCRSAEFSRLRIGRLQQSLVRYAVRHPRAYGSRCGTTADRERRNADRPRIRRYRRFRRKRRHRHGNDRRFLRFAANGVGYLNVGYAGDGTLSVLNGGTVAIGAAGTFLSNGTSFTGGGLGIGQSAAAAGTVTVSGTASRLTDLGGIAVGKGGQGVLGILNGGSLSVATGITAGLTAGSSGLVLVSGAGASLVNNGTANSIIIGDGGTGTLDVQAGGSVKSADNFDLGGSASGPIGTAAGVMAVSGSSTAEAHSLYIWSGSTISVDSTSGVDLGTSGTFTAGAIAIEANRVLFGEGLVLAAVVNDGAIRVSNSATLANSSGGDSKSWVQ